MPTQELTPMNYVHTLSIAKDKNQYTLWQILGIWTSVALPIGLIYWVVIPTLHPHLTVEPGFVYYVLITLGLVWKGAISYIILWREVKPFTSENLKDRLWLYTPSHPRTRVPSRWLYLWTIPLSGLAFLTSENLGWLNDLWAKTFPFLAARPYGVIQNLAGPAEGQWWLMGALDFMIVFNYLLGEESIFRGILLPKMNGGFGKWDWVANHNLFSAYHLHFFCTTPTRLLVNWVDVWPTKRFKSYWMGAIIHGSGAVGPIFMFILAIKGLV